MCTVTPYHAHNTTTEKTTMRPELKPVGGRKCQNPKKGTRPQPRNPTQPNPNPKTKLKPQPQTPFKREISNSPWTCPSNSPSNKPPSTSNPKLAVCLLVLCIFDSPWTSHLLLLHGSFLLFDAHFQGPRGHLSHPWRGMSDTWRRIFRGFEGGAGVG